MSQRASPPQGSKDSLAERLSERVARLMDIARSAVHVGWLPFVLLVGYLRCDPRPPLFRMLNPLG